MTSHHVSIVRFRPKARGDAAPAEPDLSLEAIEQLLIRGNHMYRSGVASEWWSKFKSVVRGIEKAAAPPPTGER